MGLVGPELAHLSRVYLESPRALVFRSPSSEWLAWVVLLPIATRLSLLANPIFGQLTRAWGYNLRFVGIDREHRVFDFRSLLSDGLLTQLIRLLGQAQDQRVEHRKEAGLESPRTQALTTDLLFASLAADMLTVLDRRRSDWGKHLDTSHRLETDQRDSLFQRESRYPDFMKGLHVALRNGLIDLPFYGRVLRSIDLREQAIEQRLANFLESCLDPISLAKLSKASVGKHLGCYNWLHLSPRHAANRAHILRELPNFAAYFAESLVPLDSWASGDGPTHDDQWNVDDRGTDLGNHTQELCGEAFADNAVRSELWDQDFQNAPSDLSSLNLARTSGQFSSHDSSHDSSQFSSRSNHAPKMPTLDLALQASRHGTVHSLHWSAVLRRAVDAGQDRAVIEALAQRFAVPDNVLRRLWRDKPAGLSVLPTWQLGKVLRQLAQVHGRDWPQDDETWALLLEVSAA